MIQRDVSSWLPNLLGPDTVKVDGELISPQRNTYNFVGATQEDDPDNDQTNITLSDGAASISNASTGTLNDVVSTTAGVSTKGIRFSGAAPTVTGIADGVSDRRIRLWATGGPLVLKHQDSGSTAENRIITPSGGDLTVADEGSIALFYDGTDDRWRVEGSTGTTFSGAANTVVIADGSGGASAATNVKATTGRITVATVPGTPAATGIFGIDYSGSTRTWLSVRASDNLSDWPVLQISGSTVTLGIESGSNGTTVLQAFSDVIIALGGTNRFSVSQTLIKAQLPRVGDSQPFASDGRATQAMADANQVIGSTIYSRKQIKFTGANTSARTATFPHPSSEDRSYSKHIENACTGSDLVISTGTGTTLTMTAGQSRVVDFSPSGVKAAHVG